MQLTSLLQCSIWYPQIIGQHMSCTGASTCILTNNWMRFSSTMATCSKQMPWHHNDQVTEINHYPWGLHFKGMSCICPQYHLIPHSRVLSCCKSQSLVSEPHLHKKCLHYWQWVHHVTGLNHPCSFLGITPMTVEFLAVVKFTKIVDLALYHPACRSHHFSAFCHHSVAQRKNLLSGRVMIQLLMTIAWFSTVHIKSHFNPLLSLMYVRYCSEFYRAKISCHHGVFMCIQVLLTRILV